MQLNYLGAAYHGWQIQTDQHSIQAEIEKGVSTIANQPVSITGCGRTDTGVHARSYYAHFDHDGELPKDFHLRLNKILPPDIGIARVFPVPEKAHSRFDALSRTYKYFIHFNKDSAIQKRSFWLYNYQFDIDAMNDAASRLCIEADFTTFEKKGGGNNTSVCEVSDARWDEIDENRWVFTISANRFLRNMVRRVTGALLMVGTGKLSAEKMEAALLKQEVLEVTFAPPACGLFLWDVAYPDDLFDND